MYLGYPYTRTYFCFKFDSCEKQIIHTPVIVTFADQKGGLGKTTLCVTFANYWVMKGVRVVVIDCDFLHSIMKCRKADIKKYGESLMSYEVWDCDANDKIVTTSLA